MEKQDKITKKEDETTPKTQNSEKLIEFFIELHKNAQMAKYALEEVIKRCNDTRLKATLLNEYSDFDKLSSEITASIISLGATPKGATFMQNIMLKSSICMSTLTDDSASKLADMVIQGDNQGIMDINRLLNKSEVKDEKALNLANNLLETEQRHVDELKKYL